MSSSFTPLTLTRCLLFHLISFILLPLGCEKNEFRCSSGLCLPQDVVCNQKRDCVDGSDEANCETCRCQNLVIFRFLCVLSISSYLWLLVSCFCFSVLNDPHHSLHKTAVWCRWCPAAPDEVDYFRKKTLICLSWIKWLPCDRDLNLLFSQLRLWKKKKIKIAPESILNKH